MPCLVFFRLCVLAALTGVSLSAAITELDAKCVTEKCQAAATEVLATLDWSIDPCDDFYLFACGHFDESHQIPEGLLLWDYFQIQQSRMDNISREILDAPVAAGDPAAVTKAKNMYAACIDTEALEKRGLTPVVDVLERLGGWPVLDPDWQETKLDWGILADLAAEYGIPLVFSLSSLPNLDNANTTALYLDVPTLGLPTPLLYDAERPDILRGSSVDDLPFTKYLVRMATILRDHLNSSVSDESIARDMADVVTFMQRLVNVARTLDLNRAGDIAKSLAWTIGQLDQWTNDTLGNKTSLNWLEFLQRAFSKAGLEVTEDLPVIIGGEDSLSKLIQFIEEADPRLMNNYVLGRLLVFLTPESIRDLRDAAFDFYVEQGYINADYERWKYCVHKVQDYPNVGFSHAVAYHYRYGSFETENLEEAEEMVGDLRAAYQELLAENEWMDEETRQSAAEKADAMLVLMGFPTWTDSAEELDQFYSKMEVNRDDHFGNVARLRSFVQAMNFATLGRERDRNDWTQSPLVVNAFYNSLNNRITFPAGMMDDPFLSGDKSERVLDYGRIGAIVGHEITHGFDSVGRQYDPFGTASDWWVNGTDARFEERARCFVGQYNAYKIAEINTTVDGTKTLRENIADNGGVREAFRAFKRLKSRSAVTPHPRLPGLEKYTSEQLFFIGYATMWCRAETTDGLEQMHAKDSHSPNRFRVIGSLSNMAEFSEAFNCSIGSRMNPADKCILW